MPRSTAVTVDQYLAELSEGRRAVVGATREMVLAALPEGYQERMAWGMISYEVPLEQHSRTYNGQPLVYLALAAQKSHFALYLTGPSLEPGREEWLAERFREAGKKLDMGKSCLRFRALEDLPTGALSELIASTPPARLVALHEAARARGTTGA